MKIHRFSYFHHLDLKYTRAYIIRLDGGNNYDELFGDIYTRPNLDFKERELITLASLLTLGSCEAQLKIHTNVALNVGIAPEQIVEVCTHCIPYAGFPRVLNALFTVKAVFEERNVLN
ncbi:MAG: carboxymuconolactone decarboxylase family protein [Veillonella sp.]|uniref:carboxymuconolactone decarboxylase family protein n=1 Tax=Veillonella sp. TaxID=1926307 RepID=UPI002910D9F1|nr:carboxymuconolactone decarboxylase family protein [Veillonella sp.]MDU5731800.1 carboxymuconolactone decarboxylase family protein [Veillonella sp.]